MRNPDPAFYNALVEAPEKGLKVRKFVFITGRNRQTGAPESIGLWSGDYTVSVTVISGITGLPVIREYHGSGTLLSISSIPLVSDLTIQTVNVELSQIAAASQQAIRGMDARFAQVEIHDGLLDAVTGKLVSSPEVAFFGEIDGSPIQTPEANGEGSISLEVVSAAMRMLERKNPRKRSYEAQRRRSDDQFGRYSNAVKEWKVQWGNKG